MRYERSLGSSVAEAFGRSLASRDQTTTSIIAAPERSGPAACHAACQLVVERATRECSDFLRDEAGASTIEFCIVAVPFLGILLAIFNLGLTFFYTVNVNAAVQQAARQIKTGDVQMSGVANAADFKTRYLCKGANSVTASFIDCSQMIVDIRTSDSFGVSDLSGEFYKTASTNKFCLGAPQQVTVVRVAYPMPYFMPVLKGFGSSTSVSYSGLVNDVPGYPGWKLLIIAAAAFRTEPYPLAQYAKLRGC